jgi:hypothetical protein
MRAVIAGAGSPYKGDVLRRLELTKDMVRKALPRLTATAEIELVGEKYAVVDPLFAEWIERIIDPFNPDLPSEPRQTWTDGESSIGRLVVSL